MNNYDLEGLIVITTWSGEIGWKKIIINTDQEGFEKIVKDPLRDFLRFGGKVNYVCLEVYPVMFREIWGRSFMIKCLDPVNRIEAGKLPKKLVNDDLFWEKYAISIPEEIQEI